MSNGDVVINLCNGFAGFTLTFLYSKIKGMIEEHKCDYKKEHNTIMSQPKHFSSLQQIYFLKQQQDI